MFLNVHMCTGTLTRELLRGYLVVYTKINNIPAVFNIPASHTLLLSASGIMLPLGLLEEAPQSPTVLLTQAVASVPYSPII